MVFPFSLTGQPSVIKAPNDALCYEVATDLLKELWEEKCRIIDGKDAAEDLKATGATKEAAPETSKSVAILFNLDEQIARLEADIEEAGEVLKAEERAHAITAIRLKELQDQVEVRLLQKNEKGTIGVGISHLQLDDDGRADNRDGKELYVFEGPISIVRTRQRIIGAEEKQC